MRLRLTDPEYAERLAVFLRSVGVRTTPAAAGVLVLEEPVDEDELGIYLRVWAVLNPEALAELEREPG